MLYNTKGGYTIGASLSVYKYGTKRHAHIIVSIYDKDARGAHSLLPRSLQTVATRKIRIHNETGDRTYNRPLDNEHADHNGEEEYDEW